MTASTTLTSYIITGYDSDDHPGGDTNLIQLSYADLDFTPSASDSYKSTSGDILKIYVDGIRIYRAHDETFASGSGFREDGDNANGQKLNGKTLDKNGDSLSWSDTSDNVWTIDTSHKTVTININNVHATNLYHNNTLTTDTGGTGSDHNPAHGQQVKFTSGTSIIELRRAVQDLKTPAIDFSNASILTEQDLDNSAKNVFHISQQAVLSTEDAMLYDSGTGTYKATQPGSDTPKKISSVASGTTTNDAVNYGQLTTHDTTITGYRDTTLAYKEDTEDYKLEAGDWAQRAGTQVKVYTDNNRTGSDLGWSAKEHAIGTAVPEGSAKDWATQDTTAIASSLFSAKEYASGSNATGGTAKEWAQKSDGAVDTEFSAKAYASVTGSNAPTDGSAKEWATTTGGAVASSEHSAKAYANETGSTAPSSGSAKEWATVTGAQIDSDYSAKEYAVGTTATSAKSYATSTGSAVTGSDYSAKEWALGDLTATGGSAKAWAVDTSSPDGSSTKSAKTWAGEAATSAASADSVSTSNAIVMGIALG
tara:strand:+ start:351 stop:1958 length:1608 start_codon:yes stop_codon:yes gene_type:complete